MNIGWERILPLDINFNFKYFKINCHLIVKRCDTNFEACNKSLHYHSIGNRFVYLKVDGS